MNMDHARTLLNNFCLRKYDRVLKDRNCKVFLVPAEFMLVNTMPVDLTTFVSSLLFPFFLHSKYRISSNTARVSN